MISVFIYFIIICAFGLWVFNIYSRPSNYPPGPWNFPFFGILPHLFLSKQTYFQKLEEWREKYGDILSLNLGTEKTIIIHGIDLMKETYSRDELVGRPLTPALYVMTTKNLRGIVGSEGKQWEGQRRFTIKSLGDLGLGRARTEEHIQDNLKELLDGFSDLGHSPVVPTRLLSLAIINSIWNIVAGKTLGIHDPKIHQLFDHSKIAASALTVPVFTSGWLQKLAPKLSGFNQYKNSIQLVREFIRDQVEEHLSTYQDDTSRDFIDLYIKEIRATTDPKSTFYGRAGEENMFTSTVNIFFTGSDTTSWTTTWGLYFLSDNPSVQKKYAKEIREVIGNSRLPSLKDRESMPYTNAIIFEILRAVSLMPFSQPHRCTVDIMIRGYKIPANTTFLINLHDLHHNKKIWGDPENFRPERFLLMDEKTLDKNAPAIAPFSVGKRFCLGENIARNNIFIILTGIIQKFCVHKENSMEKYYPSPRGLFNIPPPIKLIFEER